MKIDVTARFTALDTNFLVLIECKHHKHPIKRDVIQVLRDRLESIGAQKGMVFSTVRFQSGAVEYAKAHNIALIKVTDSEPIVFNRAGGNFDHDKIPTRKGAWLVHLNDDNKIMNSLIGMGDPYIILNEIGIPAKPKSGRELSRITGEQKI
jgi:restriction system protein